MRTSRNDRSGLRGADSIFGPFAQLTWSGLALVFAFSTPMLASSPAAERQPNVIVILTDDQGSVDANCFGATDLHTPGIDLLAERGVRFTQFYAGAPVCSPSRAALLTGRYPIRAGVPGNVSSQQGQAGMPPEQVTMGEMFQAAGYATAHVGKWHLGYTPETMPNAQGFDHSFGHMGGCIDNFSHFFYWQGPNRHDLWRNGAQIQCPGRFFPELMLTEANEFITQNKDRPFFLYVAMNTPHYPYQGEPQWREHYRDLPYPRNLYAAFVTTLDARIERLAKRIDELGLTEQTIVVYQSDNGHSTEERAHFGGGSAGPYRGAKFSLFEGGIRVPAVISWPTRLPVGAVRSQRAHACDWLPTLAELCGVEPPRTELDGRSLTAVIRSESAPSPHEVLHWTTGNSWAVREGDWKLLGNPRETGANDAAASAEPLFLADLAGDLGETKNLAADHPDVVRRLKSLHEAWRKAADGGR